MILTNLLHKFGSEKFIGNRRLALILAIMAVSLGTITFLTLIWMNDLGLNLTHLMVLLFFDFLVLLMMGIVIGSRIIRLWFYARQGAAGSHLQTRLVQAFALIATVPVAFVGLFSILYLNFAIESWFGERVTKAINQTNSVTEAYLKEHKNAILGDLLGAATGLNANGLELLKKSPQDFQNYLTVQSIGRRFSEAIVFMETGLIVAKAGANPQLVYPSFLPEWAMERAREGQAALMIADDNGESRGVIKLSNFIDTYLYVSRPVDSSVLNFVNVTRDAFAHYNAAEQEKYDLQVITVSLYAAIILLLLASASWVGLVFATKLSGPILSLMETADKIRTGDWSAKVVIQSNRKDEFARLSRTFNKMVDQIYLQRMELEQANQVIDSRRRFTEAVLAGVPVGVLGLDKHGRVELPNRVAMDLLAVEEPVQLIGQHVRDILPNIADLLERAQHRPDRVTQTQIEWQAGKNTKTILIRATAEIDAQNDLIGYVITLDDVSDLLTAQKMAAWADVARRIAHEIKNPLTPIQLSAERLKRRYLEKFEDKDRDVFTLCIETIIRQVGDIGNMVDEFSNFARMPDAVKRTENLTTLIHQSVSVPKAAHPELVILTNDLPERVAFECDQQQIRQVLTNLIKNAMEGIESKNENLDDPSLKSQQIEIKLEEKQDELHLSISDDGIGLPTEEREKLLEPYVTTRKKGTGLGLSIVRKIVEDHNGKLVLGDSNLGGAKMTLIFPNSAT